MAEHRASNMMEHTNMVQLVVRCVLDQEKAMTDLYVHLRYVSNFQNSLTKQSVLKDIRGI